MEASANLSQRLGALMKRERQTRFAGGVIGAYWAYLTPVAWIGFVVILFQLLGREPPIYVAPEIFVATGVLPYIAFRQTVTSLGRSVAANRFLLYVRPVSENDLLLAASLLEAINFIATSALIFGLITIIFDTALPHNPGRLLIGLGLAWLLAAGFGRFIAAISMVSDSFSRAVPIMLRPLFWVSGIFYTATELSGPLQSAIWYSPLLHVTEIVREGYFLGYVSPVATPWYVVFLAAAFYLLSSPIAATVVQSRRARHRL